MPLAPYNWVASPAKSPAVPSSWECVLVARLHSPRAGGNLVDLRVLERQPRAQPDGASGHFRFRPARCGSRAPAPADPAARETLACRPPDTAPGPPSCTPAPPPPHSMGAAETAPPFTPAAADTPPPPPPPPPAPAP